MPATLLQKPKSTGEARFSGPGGPGETGVAIRHVVKEFGDGDTRLRVLHDITVDVFTSQLTLLVGPSGCGKTTLISIIAGLLDPTQGEVELFGVRQSALKGRRLVDFRAANVGFVFQQYNLLPALTAAENVALPRELDGEKGRVARRLALAALEEVGIVDLADRFPDEMSGGQQQRVAIARALVHGPRLLVCDEPTAALDAQSGRTVMELLKEVAVEPDRSVIVVTHDSRVTKYGDRTIEMADGRITKVTGQDSDADDLLPTSIER